MRLGGLLTLALLLAPVASFAGGVGAATTEHVVRHYAEGWASVEIDVVGGFTASVRVLNGVGDLTGRGILIYDAAGAYAGGIVSATDGNDRYSAGEGGAWQWQLLPDGSSRDTLSRACFPCEGRYKLVLWYAGDADWWELRVQSPDPLVVGASYAGDGVFAMTNEDFGGSEIGTDGTRRVFGQSAGYAALDERTTIVAEHALVGAFPRITTFWDDDFGGRDHVDLQVALPDGGSWRCGPMERNCRFGEPHGPGAYEVRVEGAAAGWGWVPVLFTGADARIP